MINGTGYNINFSEGIYAMLYQSGNMVIQRGQNVKAGETLINSYTGFENKKYITSGYAPWSNMQNSIVNVSGENIWLQNLTELNWDCKKSILQSLFLWLRE